MKPTITLTIGKHEYILTLEQALDLATLLHNAANIATAKQAEQGQNSQKRGSKCQK